MTFMFTPHDITLTSQDGISFPFWKDILIQQSDFFRAKFSIGMKDSKDTVVYVDTNYTLLQVVLSMCQVLTLGGEINDMTKKMINGRLIGLYNFCEKYGFMYILKAFLICVGNMEFSVEMFKFVRSTSTHLFSNDMLIHKFMKLYRDRGIITDITREVDESIWTEIATRNEVHIILDFITTKEAMSNNMRRKIIKHLPLILKRSLGPVTYSRIFDSKEDVKWLRDLRIKIVSSIDRQVYRVPVVASGA